MQKAGLIDSGEKNFKEGEILVKFRKGVSEGKKKSKHDRHGARKLKKYKRIDVELVGLAPGMTVKEAVARYKADPDVEYAEPNYVVKALNTPNDPYFNELWGLYNSGQTGGTPNADISAPAAWDVTTGNGDGSVVVAVIDTGIDYTHEDLVGNLWTNTAEIPANGIDDDGNGYIDDVYGINAITGSSDSGDPNDDNGHGTHCAGTIGAVGDNGIGVAGVNWNVKIMSCKFLNANGSGYTSDAAVCLEYIADMKSRGVNVIATSNSWGGGGYSQTVYDAISAQMANDILFIAAAGNSSRDNDAVANYPSNYAVPNVVAVAATDNNDAKAGFSNWGRHMVHVGAPGVNIVSARAAGTDMYRDGLHFIPAGDPNAKYYRSSGTSMAAPHVSGLAALIKAADPGRDWKALRSLILSGGDDIASLNGITITGKRINAYGSLSCSNSPVFSVLKAPSSFTVGVPVVLSALSIDCAGPAGPVTATASTGEIVDLHDDGVSPDQVAGDGIFSAEWTPTAPTYSVLLSSPFGSQRVPPPAITTDFLLEGNVRNDYHQTLEVVGGVPPLSWSVISGSLPPGLSLDASTGEISGRPTAVGKYSFRVQVADAESGSVAKDLFIPVSNHFIVEEAARIEGEGSGRGVALDSSGNLHVTGWVANDVGGSDYLTIKYDSAGNVVWKKTYRRSGDEDAQGIAVDNSGNVYVTGLSFNGTTGYDLHTIQYDASGEVQWTNSIDVGWGSAGKVAVDRDGNILVCGTVRKGSAYDYVVAKLSPAGNEIWKTFYDHNGNDDYAYGVAVDWTGNVFVAGHTTVVGPTDYDNLVVKLDPLGEVVWARTFDWGWYDFAYDVAVDSAGNAYVTGTVSLDDFQTVKFDAQGNLKWVQWYDDGIANGGWGITIDQYDDVYVSGYSNVDMFVADAVLLKYTASGNLLWTKRADRGSKHHAAQDIAVRQDGAIFTAGHFDTDFLVHRYRNDSLRITSQPARYGPVNVAYSQTLAAAGGTEPYTWSIASGSLPPGLVLDGQTGVISGTPTVVGAFPFTVQVTDAGASSAAEQFTIHIYDPLAVVTASLTTGMVSAPYYETITATGGTAPYLWDVVAGGLPPGLALNWETGALSGIPTAEGTFAFTVRVTDMANTTADRNLSVDISSDALVPVTTASPAGGSYVAAQTVRLTTSEPATVYCTTDGTDPVIPGSACNQSVIVSASLTLKYFSVDPAGNQEPVKTETYLIGGGEARSWGSNFLGQLGDGTWDTRLTPVLVTGLGDGVVSVAGGGAHTVALRKDGTVWAWGYNGDGQLGSGAGNSPTPVQVNGLSGVIAVAAGFGHTIALRNDGTVWTWGRNNKGQLGDGTTSNSSTPVQVDGLTDVIAVAAGFDHTTALRNDGTVWSWGDNSLGQLGNGTTTDSPVPVQAEGLTDAVAITCGNYHTAAVTDGGDVWIWGYENTTIGSTNYVTSPVPVDGIDNVTKIAAGGEHTIALKDDGTVWAWGANGYGQLGSGYTSNYRYAPVPVTGLSNIVDIACGNSHSMALGSNGWVSAWGNNTSGQIGNGTTTNRTVPASILSGAAFIAAGQNHSIALRLVPLVVETVSFPEGALNHPYNEALTMSGGLAPYTWSVSAGSLPPGLNMDTATGAISGTPTSAGTYGFTAQVTDVTSTSATKQLSIKINASLAITSPALPSGAVASPYSQTLDAVGGVQPYTWSISAGSLPAGLSLNGTTGEIAGIPSEAGTFGFTVQVSDSLGLTAEKPFSLFITADGIAPVTTADPPGGSFIAAQTVRLTTNETATIYCTTDSTDPVVPDDACIGTVTVSRPLTLKYFAVDPSGNAEAVKSQAYAITGGEVWAWGNNTSGQLGNGTTTGSPIPVDASGINNVIAVDAGSTITVALRKDGTVWGWGRNYEGQLGIGTTNSYVSTPVQASGLGNVVAVATGGYHTMALRNDGTVWAWGDNYYGAFGNGTTAGSLTPVQVTGLAGALSLDAGGSYTVVLKNDGTVWAAGYNYYGQLGNGTNSNSATLVPVSDLAGVVDVVAGGYHTLAVKSDGTVWAWGNNGYGQLGDGTTTNRNIPVQVSGLTDVVDVAANNFQSLALKSDGTVWAWGSNILTPAQVGGLAGVVSIAAGNGHSLAIKNDGTVWAWGSNNSGQLGNGTTISSSTPVQVTGLSGAAAIAAGSSHSIALKSAPLAIETESLPESALNYPYNGSLAASGGLAPYAWSITAGSLPPGLVLNGLTGVISGSPTLVGTYGFTVQVSDALSATAAKAVSITVNGALAITTSALPSGAAGSVYSQVLEAAGGVQPYGWSISAGSLPAGLSLNSETGELSGIPAVDGTFSVTVKATDAFGLAVEKQFSLLIYPDVIAPVTTASPSGGSYIGAQTVWLTANEPATVYCTTDGTDPVVPDSVCTGPVNVYTSLTVKYFAVDPAGNTEAVKSATYVINGGEVAAWGRNSNGQLGDGTTTTRPAPVQVNGLSDVIAMAGGDQHTVALRKDGTVWAWGNNGSGQLGNGTTTSSLSPVQASGLTEVSAIAAGGYHTIALKSDGTVWAWGSNSYGQFGNGTTSMSSTPVQVSGLNDMIAIAAGMNHTVVVKNDGTVWASGYNSYGQLGNGMTSNSSVPVQVSGLTGAVAVAAGGYHSSALKIDGTAWSWGRNSEGQLGNGTTVGSSTPVQATGLTGAVAIATGRYHTGALKSDGTVWAWGYNTEGQLGNGAESNSSVPVQVNGLTGAVSIAAGERHTLALRNDGTVWAWGRNAEGQLGNGTTTYSSTIPVQVSGLSGAAAVAAGERHSIALIPSPLTVSTGVLADGTVNHLYSQTLSASGGLAPYTWTITAGTLPDGLALNAATGEIAGTAAAAGTFDFTVQVTDAGSSTATAALSISVYEPLVITTSSLSSGTVGTAYNQMLSATGGLAPYVWSIPVGSLPDGLSLNASTGEITGTPTTTGTFNFTVQVTDGRSISTTSVLAIAIYDPLAITTSALAYGVTGTAYSQVLSAAGGLAPYTWSVSSGSLPPGLSLNSATGEIVGTPSTTGGFAFTVQATDARSVPVEKSFTIDVYNPLVITAYSWWITPVDQAVAWQHPATGGLQPYTWSIVAGSLPNGLTLESSTGRISGTPTELGWFYYTLQAVDAVGAIDTQEFSFKVYQPLTITTPSLPFGTIGGAYDQTMTNIGGTPPFTWSISVNSLPPGLTIDSATGRISGTPTTTGTYTFAVRVADYHTQVDAQFYTIVVYEALVVNDPALPFGTAGSAYSRTVSATGGLQPYTWSISAGSLPAGLALDSATGEIAGTPAAAGTSSFTVQATDTNGTTAAILLTVNVYDPLLVGTASLPFGTAGSAYSRTVSATGGLQPYTWSISAGNLPSGLALDSATGEIAGTPAAAGPSNFTVQVTDANGTTNTRALTINVYDPLLVGTASLPFGTAGSAYSRTVSATGGLQPYSWSVSAGSLPSGLALDSATGEIAGTPAAAGTSNFTVQVTDANGTTNATALTIIVYDPLLVTTTALVDCKFNKDYIETLAATGGLPPYTWSISAGILPDGLVLDPATGTITGISKTRGTYNFTVEVQDANTTISSQALSILVN